MRVWACVRTRGGGGGGYMRKIARVHIEVGWVLHVYLEADGNLIPTFITSGTVLLQFVTLLEWDMFFKSVKELKWSYMILVVRLVPAPVHMLHEGNR